MIGLKLVDPDRHTSFSARFGQRDQQIATTKWEFRGDLLGLFPQRHQAAPNVTGQGSAERFNTLSESTGDQPTWTIFIQHRDLLWGQLQTHPVHFFTGLEGVSNFGRAGTGQKSRRERGRFGSDTPQPLPRIFISQRIRFGHPQQFRVAFVGFPEPFLEASGAHHVIGELAVVERVPAGIACQQVTLSASCFHFSQPQHQLAIGDQEILSAGKPFFHQSVLDEQFTGQSWVARRECDPAATVQLQAQELSTLPGQHLTALGVPFGVVPTSNDTVCGGLFNPRWLDLGTQSTPPPAGLHDLCGNDPLWIFLEET